MLYGSWDGKGVWRGMDTCICMTKTLHCSSETITTLLISYTSIQIKVSKNNKCYTENKTKQKPSHSRFNTITNQEFSTHLGEEISFKQGLFIDAISSQKSWTQAVIFQASEFPPKPTCLTGVPSGCHHAPILAQDDCGMWSV